MLPQEILERVEWDKIAGIYVWEGLGVENKVETSPACNTDYDPNAEYILVPEHDDQQDGSSVLGILSPHGYVEFELRSQPSGSRFKLHPISPRPPRRFSIWQDPLWD